MGTVLDLSGDSLDLLLNGGRHFLLGGLSLLWLLWSLFTILLGGSVFLGFLLEAFDVTILNKLDGFLDVGIRCTGILGGSLEVLLVLLGWLLTVLDPSGDSLDLLFDGGFGLLLLGLNSLLWLGWLLAFASGWLVSGGLGILGFTTLAAFLGLLSEAFGVTTLDQLDDFLDVSIGGTGLLSGSLELSLVLLGWLLTVLDLSGDSLDLLLNGGRHFLLGLLVLGWLLAFASGWLLFAIFALGFLTLGFFTLVAFLGLLLEALGVTTLDKLDGFLDVGIRCTGLLGGSLEVLLVFLGWLKAVLELIGNLSDCGFDGGFDADGVVSEHVSGGAGSDECKCDVVSHSVELLFPC